jgi:Kef-type K+ transport system membrane component KefB
VNPDIVTLGAVVIAATILGGIARAFKQPILLAYILAGIALGALGIHQGALPEGTLRTFADLGVVFVLFLVGLEINWTSLRLVGKTAIGIGLLQILITAGGGYGIGVVLGYSPLVAFYLGIACAFSSTIIVVKLLSERRDLQSLYGKMAVGILLVQDTVAVLLLVALGGIASHGTIAWGAMIMTFLKGVVLFSIMIWLGRTILPRIFHSIARTPELLFFGSLSWVFFVAGVVSALGFSAEIGGLLAGLSLANTSEYFQISQKIRPLRDFFILIFFALLGSSFLGSASWQTLAHGALIGLYVLIATPLIVTGLMLLQGYRTRTALYTGMTLGQMSEFSLIIAALGVKIGHLPGAIPSILTTAAILSIALSTYLMTHTAKVIGRLKRIVGFLERKNPHKEFHQTDVFEKPFILIGAHRTGESIARHLPADDLLIIEFDPDVIEGLRKGGMSHIFGDVNDPEVFEKANFGNAKLVISTSPDLHDNLELIKSLHALNHTPRVIVRAEDEDDAKLLYKAGADYVLLPHFTSGQYLGKTLALDPDFTMLDHLRMGDRAMLDKR